MARMVKCIKLGREAEGLDFPPYPGELGKRIFENVSKQEWHPSYFPVLPRAFRRRDHARERKNKHQL